MEFKHWIDRLTSVPHNRKDVNLHWKEEKVDLNKMMVRIGETADEFTWKALEILHLDKPVPSEKEQKITSIIQSLSSAVEGGDTKAGTGKKKEISYKSEPTVQEELTKAWFTPDYPRCFGLDAHSTNHNAPHYKLPHYKNNMKYPKSAKCDLVSTAGPIMLELKQSTAQGIDEQLYELFCQMIERVFVLAKLQEFVRKIVCFGSCGPRSWIFMLIREYPSDGKILENYYFGPFATNLIVPTWHLFNSKSREDAFFYCNPDALSLSKIVRCLGHHVGYSKVKALRISSTNSIYQIYPAADKGGDIPVNEENSIVIKLVHYSSTDAWQRGLNELTTINHLIKRDLGKAIDYVIATVRGNRDHLIVTTNNTNGRICDPMNKDMKEFKIDYANLFDKKMFAGTSCEMNLTEGNSSPGSTNNVAWWNYEPNAPEEFTAIVMYPGKQIDNICQWDLGLFRCLAKLHEGGVLHCDLRIPNFMLFNSRILHPNHDETADRLTESPAFLPFIVDFDLSRVLPAGTDVISFSVRTGGQRSMILQVTEKLQKNRETSLPATKSAKEWASPEEFDVQWNKECEICMLRTSITLKASSAPSTTIPPPSRSADSAPMYTPKHN